MKTTSVAPVDFARSVLAVPPVALNDDLTLNEAANRQLIRHMERGGITTLLYGGNANLHNYPLGRFEELLGLIAEASADATWVIPSVGPDYGKMMDQAPLIARSEFPLAMILPLTFPRTPAGSERGIRDFVNASGKPVIVYIKQADYLPPAVLGRLMEEGLVYGIKYAVPREDFTDDPYLAAILEHCDAGRIVSGFGELPAVPHLRRYGLAGFTAGAVCIAPRRSMAILAALKADDHALVESLLEPVRPFEALREKHSPIRVLHDAVTLSGIANMGPMMPLMSNIEKEHLPAIKIAATALLERESELLPGIAAAE